jgi:hypothetical protein
LTVIWRTAFGLVPGGDLKDAGRALPLDQTEPGGQACQARAGGSNIPQDFAAEQVRLNPAEH